MNASTFVAEKVSLQRSPLRVGSVDDPLEHEAEAVVDRAARMSSPSVVLIQRCPGGCPDEVLRRQPVGEEKEDELIQCQPMDEEKGKLMQSEVPMLRSGGLSSWCGLANPTTAKLGLVMSTQRLLADNVSLQRSALRVGAVDDPLERDADAVADQVMRMPSPRVGLIHRCPHGCPDEGVIRRRSAKEDKEELTHWRSLNEDKELRTKELSVQSSAVKPQFQVRIDPLRQGGESLAESHRAFFEPRFNANFSTVRIHRNSEAAQTARRINARAFTVGRHIVFGSGQFDLTTWDGRHLLAHELAHVIQSSSQSPPVDRKSSSRFGGGTVETIGPPTINCANVSVIRRKNGEGVVVGSGSTLSEEVRQRLVNPPDDPDDFLRIVAEVAENEVNLPSIFERKRITNPEFANKIEYKTIEKAARINFLGPLREIERLISTTRGRKPSWLKDLIVQLGQPGSEKIDWHLALAIALRESGVTNDRSIQSTARSGGLDNAYKIRNSLVREGLIPQQWAEEMTQDPDPRWPRAAMMPKSRSLALAFATVGHVQNILYKQIGKIMFGEVSDPEERAAAVESVIGSLTPLARRIWIGISFGGVGYLNEMLKHFHVLGLPLAAITDIPNAVSAITPRDEGQETAINRLLRFVDIKRSQKLNVHTKTAIVAEAFERLNETPMETDMRTYGFLFGR